MRVLSPKQWKMSKKKTSIPMSQLCRYRLIPVWNVCTNEVCILVALETYVWVVACYKFGPRSWATAPRVCNLYSAFRGLPVNFQSRNHARTFILWVCNHTSPINHQSLMFQASIGHFAASDSHFWSQHVWSNGGVILVALVFHQTSLLLRCSNEKFIWKHCKRAHDLCYHIQC